MNNVFVYPCHVEDYDVVDHFSKQDTLVWRATSDTIPGDIVYIYVSKTLKAIKYKCVVISYNLDRSKLDRDHYAIPKGKSANWCSYVLLKKIASFPDTFCTLRELKAHGMRQFMVPMHAPAELQHFLCEREKQHGGHTDA